LGPKLIDPPEGPRSNHFVIEELGKRLGVGDRPGFGMTEQQHIDTILGKRGLGSFSSLKQQKWLDLQPDFEAAHFIDGFGHADGKFRFRADWTGQAAPNRPPKSMGLFGPVARLPEFPDHVDLIEVVDAAHPFRLATSPA
ncbi:MAG: molybdopterin oxidoreductase family protein, partial [Mesorhizobium sp.]